MKRKMVVLILALILGLYCNTAHSHNDNWIPATNIVPVYNVAPKNAPIVPVYIYNQPLYTLNYQWVPYYYSVPVITEKRCWFLKREKQINYVPQIYWNLQPVYYKW